MNHDAVNILKWVFRYSSNESCVDSAGKMLVAILTGDQAGYTQQYGYAGDFMKACADGRFFDAIRRADPLNIMALQKGMTMYLIDPGHEYSEKLDVEEFKRR